MDGLSGCTACCWLVSVLTRKLLVQTSHHLWFSDRVWGLRCHPKGLATEVAPSSEQHRSHLSCSVSSSSVGWGCCEAGFCPSQSHIYLFFFKLDQNLKPETLVGFQSGAGICFLVLFSRLAWKQLEQSGSRPSPSV